MINYEIPVKDQLDFIESRIDLHRGSQPDGIYLEGIDKPVSLDAYYTVRHNDGTLVSDISLETLHAMDKTTIAHVLDNKTLDILAGGARFYIRPTIPKRALELMNDCLLLLAISLSENKGLFFPDDVTTTPIIPGYLANIDDVETLVTYYLTGTIYKASDDIISSYITSKQVMQGVVDHKNNAFIYPTNTPYATPSSIGAANRVLARKEPHEPHIVRTIYTMLRWIEAKMIDIPNSIWIIRQEKGMYNLEFMGTASDLKYNKLLEMAEYENSLKELDPVTLAGLQTG